MHRTWTPVSEMRTRATGATPALAGRAARLEAGFPGRCPEMLRAFSACASVNSVVNGKVQTPARAGKPALPDMASGMLQ